MIEGVIDNSHRDDQLGGWAIDREAGSRLTIEARRGRTLLAAAPIDQDRPDLGGQHGFTLIFDRPIDTFLDQGTPLMVRGIATDGRTAPLTWHPPLVSMVRTRTIGRRLAALPASQLTHVLAATIDASPSPEIQRFASWIPLLEAAPVQEGGWGEPLSRFLTAPGIGSIDGLAVSGLEGHVFLRGGSNDLAAQFAAGRGDPAAVHIAAQWHNCFRARAERLAAMGIAYLQLVIPEKTSILPEYWPGAIETPTALLARLEADIAGDVLPYLSGYAAMRGSPDRLRLFRKVGTHLTVDGGRFLFKQICSHLGFAPPFERDQERIAQVWDGDFKDSFPALPLLERVEIIDGPGLRRAAREFRLLRSALPGHGQHIGTHMAWENAAAPIDRSVLAFGNSFFERGGAGDCLSWWCARAFRRFEFVWAPDFDFDLVERVKPDIVIGQTIERFLPRVASA